MIYHLKVKKLKKKEYPLIGKWKLWKHSLDESDWSIESYKKFLPEFKTLNEFWKIYNNHSGITNGLYFLMRSHIKPIFEDKYNAKGSTWSFKIDRKELPETWEKSILDIWTDLSISLITEKLTNSMSRINGVSLHPKRDCVIIKIWNKDQDPFISIKNNPMHINQDRFRFKVHSI